MYLFSIRRCRRPGVHADFKLCKSDIGGGPRDLQNVKFIFNFSNSENIPWHAYIETKIHALKVPRWSSDTRFGKVIFQLLLEKITTLLKIAQTCFRKVSSFLKDCLKEFLYCLKSHWKDCIFVEQKTKITKRNASCNTSMYFVWVATDTWWAKNVNSFWISGKLSSLSNFINFIVMFVRYLSKEKYELLKYVTINPSYMTCLLYTSPSPRD